MSHRNSAYYAHSSAVDGNNVLGGRVTLCLVQAVPARLVESAESIGDESSNIIFAAQGVVLEDLLLLSVNLVLWY